VGRVFTRDCVCVWQTPSRVSQGTVNVSYGQLSSFCTITTKHRLGSKYTPQLGILKSITTRSVSCNYYPGKIAVWILN